MHACMPAIFCMHVRAPVAPVHAGGYLLGHRIVPSERKRKNGFGMGVASGGRRAAAARGGGVAAGTHGAPARRPARPPAARDWPPGQRLVAGRSEAHMDHRLHAPGLSGEVCGMPVFLAGGGLGALFSPGLLCHACLARFLFFCFS